MSAVHKDIRLSKVLKENLIDLALQSKNKNETISGLVELLSKSRKIKNKKLFLKAMLEREKLGSTGIGNGVAIPHAKSEGVGDFIIAFARKDSGIDFGALDGEKTYLFFAMASSKNEVGAHLKVLAQISGLVRDKFIVELLRRTKNKKEILKIISDAERHA